eukprot:3516472-Heterocapsa_arctica.AAC.1
MKIDAPRSIAGRNPLEGGPEHSEYLPMALDLLHSSLTSTHAVVLPRTTSRARTREPQTAGETPKIVSTDD